MYVALLNLNEGESIDDLKLEYLDIRKILKTTDTGGTRELQLAYKHASYDGGSMK